MTKKTYAQVCLEKAEKATPGPWKRDEVTNLNDMSVWAGNDRFLANICEMSDTGYLPAFDIQRDSDAEFIAHARTDVPELARRLKKACDILRGIAKATETAYPIEIADELEAMPEGEK